MTLTDKAKNEIAVLPPEECCFVAMLSAIIHSAGSISFSSDGVGVYIESENRATLKVAAQIIYGLYGKRFYCKNGLKVHGKFVTEMLFDLGILTYYGEEIGAMAGINGFVVAKECCAKSYLRGLFLGCGSVSVAKKYHLEMSFSSSDMAEDVCALLCGFDIIAGYTTRKDKHLVYIKSAESISDFFALIGANRAVLELNNTAALRSVNMYANRRINCDLANADKVVEASLRQVEAINKVMKRLDDPKLIETAKARLENPDTGYEGLAEILNVSKGCVKYRLKKIVDLADEADRGRK